MEQAADVRREARPAYSPHSPPRDAERPAARDGAGHRAEPIAADQTDPGVAVRRSGRAVRLPTDVEAVLAVEQHAVAMTFATFLVTLAAALLYQGAAAGSTSGILFVLGMGCFLIAGAVAVMARWRLRARLDAAAARVEQPTALRRNG